MKALLLKRVAKSAAILSVGIYANFATAGILQVDEGDFIAGSGLITFSEFALGTVNPHYDAADYGGDVGGTAVDFAGWFLGQGLSPDPGFDCPGASPTACIVGDPGDPLTLDPGSTDTFITPDGANPTSPVLSGTPTFNGGIAVLFSIDQFGVGFDGGFFDAVGSTAITAFSRDGTLLGSVSNSVTGIEFLGLVSDTGTAEIAGVFLDLVGAEPAGFAIDNIRFGLKKDIRPVSTPASAMLFLLGVYGLLRVRKTK